MKSLLVTVTLGIFPVIPLVLGLSYAPQTSLGIPVNEIDNGVLIQNVSHVDCLVFVNLPEGEQQFELAVGQNTTVAGISQPIEVSAVSQ